MGISSNDREFRSRFPFLGFGKPIIHFFFSEGGPLPAHILQRRSLAFGNHATPESNSKQNPADFERLGCAVKMTDGELGLGGPSRNCPDIQIPSSSPRKIIL